MKSILTAIAAVCALALGACATTGTQTPAQVLQAYCNVSTPEIAAFQADATLFSANVQKALALVTPLNATMCSPTAIAAATSGDVTTYVQQVLPALTTIAIEFALITKAQKAALPADSTAPILGVQ